MEETEFTGLTMPVFTAFGWTGEKAALEFALSQINLFINALHQNLSPEAKLDLPFFGLNKEANTVFLATNPNTEEGPYITFNARPLALEVKLSITDKAAISRGLKRAEADPDTLYRQLNKLEPDWQFHIQQMHVDEESGEVSFYQDLIKEPASTIDAKTLAETISRALFLNSEGKWIMPVHLSHKIPSERVASAGREATILASEEIDKIIGVLYLFTRQAKTKGKSSKKSKKSSSSASSSTGRRVGRPRTRAIETDAFTYMAVLKPLHLRRGFINLTPEHWPFFAKGARTESTKVSLSFAGSSDKDSSVWRMQPNDLARIVLSEKAHEWLESAFAAEDQIMVEATKVGEDIKISLSEVSDGA